MNTSMQTKSNAPVQSQGSYIIQSVTSSPIAALPGTPIILTAVIQNTDGTPAKAGVSVQWKLETGELYISLSGDTSATDDAGVAYIQAVASAPSGGRVRISVDGASIQCGLHFSDPLFAAPLVLNAEMDHHLDGNEIESGVGVYIPAPPDNIVPQPGDVITFNWDGVESLSYSVPNPPVFPYYIDVSQRFTANCFYDGFYELLYDYTTLVGNMHSSMSFPLEITGNPAPATLPSPTFPDVDATGSLIYKSVMDNAGTDMKVSYPGMAEGDVVTAKWYGYQTSASSPIPGTTWSQPRTLTAQDIVAQYTLFHIPDTVITPAVDANAQGNYQVVSLNGSSALSGNADVKIISAREITITEQMEDNGLYPLIYPGKTGKVTFTIDTNFASDVAGSRIHFVAPTGTTLVNASIPDLEGSYSFDANTGNLTLTKDGVVWSTCTLTLQASSSATPLTSISDGSAQYFFADGSPVGGVAPITVNFSCAWDYVTDVSCLIAMESSSDTYENTGTLFMNGASDSSGEFKAHCIPVFRGFTFTMADGIPAPSKEEVQNALTLVNKNGEVLLGAGLIDTARYTDFKQPYNNRSSSEPTPQVSYSIELDPLAIWCSRNYSDTLPTDDLSVCMQLRAEKTDGTYTFNSDSDKGVSLGINFTAMKKYQNSNYTGGSNYILINSNDGDYYHYHNNGEVRKVGTTHLKRLFRVSIDSTPENSRYVFKFFWFEKYNFDHVVPAGDYFEYGREIDSIYIKGMSLSGQPQWTNYGQHLILPPPYGVPCSMNNTYIYPDQPIIGYTGTHEAHGWACSGSINANVDSLVVNSGELVFAGLSIDYESSSEGVEFKSNNMSDSSDHSRLHLIDNFGNHVYMNPVCGAGVDSLTLTMQINTK
ncbi:hypothetical protein CJP72_19010 [Citrobacter sp. NCU1]|uniref:hypothetical protein n=1 Tax=Citrobacter sp. NCU1 TaxID=2026683 RepID=UPI001390AD9B|nr:hypothetical protein [Citrobacter sp. NCU1]NDO82785.1 hypothetical protein [Citrobacter sp. NCU1]